MIPVRIQVHDAESGGILLTTIINHDLSNDEENLICVPTDLEQEILSFKNRDLAILCTGPGFEIRVKMNLKPPATIEILKEPTKAIVERFMFRLRGAIREYLKEISSDFLFTPKK